MAISESFKSGDLLRDEKGDNILLVSHNEKKSNSNFKFWSVIVITTQGKLIVGERYFPTFTAFISKIC